jgi:hypothetical protein
MGTQTLPMVRSLSTDNVQLSFSADTDKPMTSFTLAALCLYIKFYNTHINVNALTNTSSKSKLLRYSFPSSSSAPLVSSEEMIFAGVNADL